MRPLQAKYFSGRKDAAGHTFEELTLLLAAMISRQQMPQSAHWRALALAPVPGAAKARSHPNRGVHPSF